MSTSDPDPARAPRAPRPSDANLPPTRRFARGGGSVDGYDTTSPVAAANAPAPAPVEGDVWSHEVGKRRFEPSPPTSGYAPDASILDPAKPGPSRVGPSIATKAFEQVVPPPSVVDASISPSAFVTDALADMAAEDGTHAAPPPRRSPGAPSVPPPGFGNHA
ncbi:MAG: hypothetical protein AAGC46_03150 [Solirubrobacteraceae bacterium]|nr:hypothetical protein [Patulibacter sp.]